MDFHDNYLTFRGVAKYYYFSKNFQYFTRDQIEYYQYKKLKKLLSIAYKNIEYYQKLFNDIDFNPIHDFKTLSDMSYIPILTKNLAKENRKKLLNKKYNNKSLKLRTSGSTGEPFEINVSYNSWIVEQSVIWRHWNWAGYKFRDKMGILRSYLPGDNGPLIYKDKLRNFIFFSPFHMTNENMKKYIDIILEEKISVLRGYPSSLFAFSKFIKDNNYSKPDIKFLLTASEVLTQKERELIETVFNAKIYDHYGLADTCVMMGECNQHNGLHNYEDYGYLELLDNNGTNKIIGTNLHNYAMPLIRYDTGDLAISNNNNCSCGRHFPLIKSIQGRKDTVILTPAGQEIPVVNFYTMFDEFLEINKWQIIQGSDYKIQFLLDTLELNNRRLKELETEIKKRLPNTIKTSILKNKIFIKTGEGKEPPFISKINFE